MCVVAEDEFSRQSLTSLTRSVPGSSTVLDHAHTDRSTSLDRVDFRRCSDIDLATLREGALTSDEALHRADTRSDAIIRYTSLLQTLKRTLFLMRPKQQTATSRTTEGKKKIELIHCRPLSRRG